MICAGGGMTAEPLDAVGAAVLALVAVIMLHAGLRRLPENPDAPAPASVYPVGQTAVVVHVDQQSNGPPYQALVRIAGETWTARLNTPTQVGDPVRVIDGDRLTLICTKDLGTPDVARATQSRASRLVVALRRELLFAIHSVRHGPGLTVRRRRLIMAAMCGFTIFTAITCGLAVAAAPAIAVLVLGVFDPALGWLLTAL